MKKYVEDTIKYYNNFAQEYFNLTSKANMNENAKKFMFYLKENDLILDFGCGSGRDSKLFKEQGYRVEAIDGSRELCFLASSLIEQEVKCMDFMDFNETNKYDAIWACASLLHLNKEDLMEVLKKLKESLKEKGYMYTCFKAGDGEEIDKNGKFYLYLTEEEILEIIKNLNGINIIETFVTSSVIKANEKPWVNLILQKKTK